MAIEPFLGTRPQRIFIAAIVVQALVVLAMIGIVFGLVQVHIPNPTLPRYKTVTCYLALFALAELFELVVAFDALRLRNIIQLGGILAFHGAVLIFSAIQIGQTRTAIVDSTTLSCVGDGWRSCANGGLWSLLMSFLIVVPIILGLSLLGLAWNVRALYAEFGWAVFHAIGADPSMKTMYQYYQILICLLKFDYFAFTGLTLQFLILVFRNESVEFGLTVAAIPVVLILLILCGVAVAREIRWIMGASLFLMIPAMGYYIYKLSRFYTPDREERYLTTRATLTVFSVMAFLLMLATFIVGIRCLLDFDKGLREAKTQGEQKPHSNVTYTPGTPTPMGEAGSSYFGAAAGGGHIGRRVSIE